MLGFQNGAPNIKLLNFTLIKTILLTLKNMIFKGNLFTKPETAIRFLASKRVHEWSWILIPSLSLLCTQNEAKFNCQFTDCLEKCEFLQMTSNIGKLYTVGKHFHHKFEFKILISK